MTDSSNDYTFSSTDDSQHQDERSNQVDATIQFNEYRPNDVIIFDDNNDNTSRQKFINHPGTAFYNKMIEDVSSRNLSEQLSTDCDRNNNSQQARDEEQKKIGNMAIRIVDIIRIDKKGRFIRPTVPKEHQVEEVNINQHNQVKGSDDNTNTNNAISGWFVMNRTRSIQEVIMALMLERQQHRKLNRKVCNTTTSINDDVKPPSPKTLTQNGDKGDIRTSHSNKDGCDGEQLLQREEKEQQGDHGIQDENYHDKEQKHHEGKLLEQQQSWAAETSEEEDTNIRTECEQREEWSIQEQHRRYEEQQHHDEGKEPKQKGRISALASEHIIRCEEEDSKMSSSEQTEEPEKRQGKKKRKRQSIEASCNDDYIIEYKIEQSKGDTVETVGNNDKNNKIGRSNHQYAIKLMTTVCNRASSTNSHLCGLQVLDRPIATANEEVLREEKQGKVGEQYMQMVMPSGKIKIFERIKYKDNQSILHEKAKRCHCKKGYCEICKQCKRCGCKKPCPRASDKQHSLPKNKTNIHKANGEKSGERDEELANGRDNDTSSNDDNDNNNNKSTSTSIVATTSTRIINEDNESGDNHNGPESHYERSIRLQLRHRYYAAYNGGMGPVEFTSKLLKFMGNNERLVEISKRKRPKLLMANLKSNKSKDNALSRSTKVRSKNNNDNKTSSPTKKNSDRCKDYLRKWTNDSLIRMMKTTGLELRELQEGLIDDSELVSIDDRGLVPDAILVAMGQLSPCEFTKDDKRGFYNDRCVGCIGLCCRHCGGDPGKLGGRYFPSSEQSLSLKTTCRSILTHMTKKCPSTPSYIRQAIINLQHQYTLNDEDIVGKKMYGSRKAFFQRIWSRLHGSDEVSASSDTASQQTCGGDRDDDSNQSHSSSFM